MIELYRVTGTHKELSDLFKKYSDENNVHDICAHITSIDAQAVRYTVHDKKFLIGTVKDDSVQADVMPFPGAFAPKGDVNATTELEVWTPHPIGNKVTAHEILQAFTVDSLEIGHNFTKIKMWYGEVILPKVIPINDLGMDYPCRLVMDNKETYPVFYNDEVIYRQTAGQLSPFKIEIPYDARVVVKDTEMATKLIMNLKMRDGGSGTPLLSYLPFLDLGLTIRPIIRPIHLSTVRFAANKVEDIWLHDGNAASSRIKVSAPPALIRTMTQIGNFMIRHEELTDKELAKLKFPSNPAALRKIFTLL